MAEAATATVTMNNDGTRRGWEMEGRGSGKGERSMGATRLSICALSVALVEDGARHVVRVTIICADQLRLDAVC